VLLHREWIDRSDLGQRSAHAAELRLELLVVERIDLLHRRRGIGLREALERQLPLAAQRGERLVPSRRLDRGRLRGALELGEPASGAALGSLQLEELAPARGSLGFRPLLGDGGLGVGRACLIRGGGV
jgi:hypothetical protein